jgi:hypothetical protein
MKLRFQLDKVCLVGLRLGATLALMTSQNRGDIAALALWDPILQGEDIEEEVEEIMAQQSMELLQQRDIEKPDTLSYCMTVEMAQALKKLNLQDTNDLPVNGLLLMETGDEASCRRLASQIDNTTTRVDYQNLEEARVWQREPYESIVPQQTIERLLAWLSEVKT